MTFLGASVVKVHIGLKDRTGDTVITYPNVRASSIQQKTERTVRRTVRRTDVVRTAYIARSACSTCELEVSSLNFVTLSQQKEHVCICLFSQV